MYVLICITLHISNFQDYFLILLVNYVLIKRPLVKLIFQLHFHGDNTSALLEFVDVTNWPSDYGGSGPSCSELAKVELK